MVYSNNFVATIKVGGKILREQNDVVALPFGSEYSIYLKNQNSVRALVRVTIDGQPLSDVADGWIIIGANDALDLKRFIRNGNFEKGNALKFIERTGAVEAHRGIGVDDGLVRVEYKFEKIVQYTQWLGGNYTIYNNGLQGGCFNVSTSGLSDTNFTYSDSSNVSYSVNTTPTSSLSGATGTVGASSCLRSAEMKSPYSGSIKGQSRITQASCNVNMIQETAVNDAGVTVPGSENDQKFSYGAWFPTEDQSHVIVLKLVGKTGNDAPVAKPVTVREKPVCVTCGKVNKATHKFCGRCGTALKLF